MAGVMPCGARGFAVERPFDLGVGTIHPAISRIGFSPQRLEFRDSSGTEALP
jgi:hypothetical protein